MPPISSNETRWVEDTLDHHDDRLKSMETLIRELGMTLIKMESGISQIAGRVEGIQSDVKSIQTEQRQTDKTLALQHQDITTRVSYLESKARESKDHRTGLMRWGAGIASAVIIALTLAFLGLR